MEKEFYDYTADTLHDMFDEHNWVRIVAYTLVGVAVFYVAGKASHYMADSIRGFRNLKDAINGN